MEQSYWICSEAHYIAMMITHWSLSHTHTCTHTNTHTCTHTHTQHTRTQTHTHTNTQHTHKQHTHTCTHMHTQHTRTHTQHTCTHTHIHAHTAHTHTHTQHTCTHTHTHAHAHTLSDDHNHNGAYNCPCAKYLGEAPPDFVGLDYFCESGNTGVHEYRMYLEDPLWDGYGPGNSCCAQAGMPWFCTTLPQEVILRSACALIKALQMKTLIYVELLEVYVQ